MKVLVIVKSTGYNFIRHLVPYLPPGSRVSHRIDEAFHLMPKFDTILFEWANDLTAQIVNSSRFEQLQKQFGFKTIVRIHDHEVTKVRAGVRRIDAIKWSRVDHVWFINPIVRDKFHELKGNGNNSFFLPNVVDPDLFPENRANTKTVGLVSLHFRRRKRIDRVVEIAKLLPDWSFDLRVELPGNTPGHEYYEEFQRFRKLAKGVDNIYLEHRDVIRTVKRGYDTADLIDWYRDKAVILSTSDWEGFHYALAEGCASGCMPVCWNWPGSETFWGPYVVSSAEQAAEAIRSYEPSGAWRKYIRSHYHPELVWARVVDKIGR